MRRVVSAMAGLAAAVFVTSASVAAEPIRTDAVSKTIHTIKVEGKPITYTAEAGRIAVRDHKTGEPHGYIFYVSYRMASHGKLRPVTFVWNGGPGSNAAPLHFAVAGPLRADGARLVDNDDTWLTATDLVFVDPVGTGFSRPAKPEYAEEFYGTVGDVASVGTFVHDWLVRHQARSAPLYLVGESWGAGRAGSVAYALEHRGDRVRGAVLISGGSGLHDEIIPPNLAQALHVVDLTATALFYGKVGSDLPKDPRSLASQADAWARTVYAPALANASSLSDGDRDAVIAQLSKFTGLAPDLIDRKTLSFSPRVYRSGLLKAEGKTLNTFDMRLTSEPSEGARDAILHYLRENLRYRTDLPYVDLEKPEPGYGQSVGNRWNYATAAVSPEEMKAAIAEAVKRGGGPPRLGPPLPSTAEEIALDPSTRFLVAAGLYDSLNSCAANAETGKQLPPALAKSITFKCYIGGHMMYRDEATRHEISADIRAMVEER